MNITDYKLLSDMLEVKLAITPDWAHHFLREMPVPSHTTFFYTCPVDYDYVIFYGLHVFESVVFFCNLRSNTYQGVKTFPDKPFIFYWIAFGNQS